MSPTAVRSLGFFAGKCGTDNDDDTQHSVVEFLVHFVLTKLTNFITSYFNLTRISYVLRLRSINLYLALQRSTLLTAHLGGRLD